MWAVLDGRQMVQNLQNLTDVVHFVVEQNGCASKHLGSFITLVLRHILIDRSSDQILIDRKHGLLFV